MQPQAHVIEQQPPFRDLWAGVGIVHEARNGGQRLEFSFGHLPVVGIRGAPPASQSKEDLREMRIVDIPTRGHQ